MVGAQLAPGALLDKLQTTYSLVEPLALVLIAVVAHLLDEGHPRRVQLALQRLLLHPVLLHQLHHPMLQVRAQRHQPVHVQPSRAVRGAGRCRQGVTRCPRVQRWR